MALLARLTWGRRGRVSPCSSQEQTLNIATFLSPAKVHQGPWHGCLAPRNSPDASWLALLFSFRFYSLSTLLLSLLNSQALGSPVPLALSLSIILPFLYLHTFSQLFFPALWARLHSWAGSELGPHVQGAVEREGRHRTGAAVRADILQVFLESGKHSNAAGRNSIQRAPHVAVFARTEWKLDFKQF